MKKERRFLPKIVAGLLALGGGGLLLEQAKKPSEMNPTNEELKPDASSNTVVSPEKESVLEQDPLFCAEHPIEAELQKHKQSQENIVFAMTEAAKNVQKNRYHDATQEKKYFSACRDVETWALTEKKIQDASKKTGVPERILIGIGFIESQFKEKVDRQDTDVHGPYQMTFDTALEAAKDATACFGSAIELNSTDDLHNTDTAVKLAALRLRALQKKYGQFGLAILDYASGSVSLERKIKEAFPKVDLGTDDWNEMVRHHIAERKAQKQRDEILTRMKQGRSSDTDRQALRQAVRTFEMAGFAYTKAKKIWKQKRELLPTTLADAGVTVLALYEHAEKKKQEIPESILYTLALDDIAAKAHVHAQESKP